MHKSMKRWKAAAVIGAGTMAIAGALPLQAAAAADQTLYLTDSQCDQPWNNWFKWAEQPLQVPAGAAPSRAMCRVAISVGPQGAKNARLNLTISAQSVTESGYSPHELAKRLVIASCFGDASGITAIPCHDGGHWSVNDDGSLTWDLIAPMDFPSADVAGWEQRAGQVDIRISGAPSTKSALLRGQIRFSADGVAEQPASTILINYTGNGADIDIADASTLVPLTPARLLDTRDGTGAARAKVGPDSTLTLQVAGRAGVPAEGVSAVVLNITATNPTGDSYVTAYPHGRSRPSASSLNFAPGKTVPNQVVVPVVDGKVNLYNHVGSVDLIADISGYYTPGTAGSRYTALATPSRLLDTRNGTGAPRAKVGPDSALTLQVAGRAGVPAEGVSGVILNVTATNPTDESYVTAYPHGVRRPTASNLNLTPRKTVPNQVVVPVVDGKVDLYNHVGSVDLIADISGYYSATGSVFVPTGPTRVYDTRNGIGGSFGEIGPGHQGGPGFILWSNGLPPYGVTAVALNVTVTDVHTSSFLTVFGRGLAESPEPATSTLNYDPGDTVANAATPRANYGVNFTNHQNYVSVIADAAGYFTAG
ncbi:hypothetical protein [Kitasatospora cineracea]|uniref:hypothetical protein n=1 Tax=Kitasatospora cineracea TaxID=88074 RepID=UPI0037B7C0A3